MATTIISGKEISKAFKDRLKKSIELLKIQKENDPNAVFPGLAVIQVGSDPASSIYVNNKKKSCEEVGIVSFSYTLDDSATESELIELIEALNVDPRVHGILCQLPLPKHMDEFSVINAIDHRKDVDGFHPVNKGLLSIGRDCLVSCTPLGCLMMLKEMNIDICGKNCVIIGRSNIVGKPLAALMLAENATVTIAHSKTNNLKALCQTADILVAAIGRSGFVTADYVKPGAVVIDVGINRDPDNKVRGDVNYDEVFEVAGAITPVPGGVGPMTIAMLMQNTYQAYLSLTQS
ncbi:MAG: bifunctional methylenetetrahydrofolate dehydrogenase/methenyltetrahydrofolate cyclohydrolase FolD [Clostridiaceae bacterium]|nr:bifunctional methylenetetrahydrofolate dehydrogenase/methenyltetrahydrofolate cyclohydrolase FolD [Clostridiaceae bacterium]